MFDLGMTELLLIGVVALIVVGPKDLPGMFRTLGRFTGKMRNMAREFSRAMNDAADEAGVKDVKDIASGLRDATSPTKMGLNRLNEAADKFESWDPAGTAAKKKPPQNAREAAGLSEDRAEAAKKIHDYTAEKARAAREAEAAETQTATPEPKKAPAKTAKTPPAKPRARSAAKAAGTVAKTAKPAAKSTAAAKTPKPRSTKAKAKPKAKPAAGDDSA